MFKPKEFPEKLLAVVSILLTILLGLSILVRWIPSRWISPCLYEAGIALIAIAWASYLVYRPSKIQLPFILVPLGVAAAWPLLQLLTHQTVSRWETENAVFLWTANFLTVVFAVQVGGSPKLQKTFLRSLAVFAFVICLVSLLQFISAPSQLLWIFSIGFPDVFGPFVSRDRFAAFAELTLPICFTCALSASRTRTIWIGMAAILFAAVIAGASRAGAILINLEALVLLAAAQQPRLRGAESKRTFWIFAAAALVCTAIVGVSPIAGRLKETDPFAFRREMLESSLEMIQDRPMLGVGLGNFVNAYPKYSKFSVDKLVDHAHNDWAEWTVDGGIPFVACLLVATVWMLPKTYKSVWGLGIPIMLLHSLVDFPMQDPAIEFWLFALVGTLAASATSSG